MYYELGHIFHGHVDYLGNETGGCFYKEIGRDLEPAISRDQEHQADNFAATITQTLFCGSPKHFIRMCLGGDRGRVVYTWAFVQSVIFTILSLSEPPNIDSELRTHPHPYCRLGAAFIGALYRAHTAGMDVGSPDLDSVMDAWKDLDTLLQSILPGRYKGFFSEGRIGQVVIPRNEAAGLFKHSAKGPTSIDFAL